jgi:phage anti-repressor protein
MNAIEIIALSLIIGFLLIAFSISLVRRKARKKQHKKLLQEFDDFIIEQDLTIDNKQRFNKNIIGIDRLNYVVVFFNDNTKKIHSVRLKDIAECSIIKEENEPGGHIQQIFLKCNYKQKELGSIIFPFYNAHKDDLFMLMTISKRANTWAKRINIFREAAILKNHHRLSA